MRALEQAERRLCVLIKWSARVIVNKERDVSLCLEESE